MRFIGKKSASFPLCYPSIIFIGDNDKASTNILDVARSLPSLTFDEHYLNPNYKRRNYIETPFREIRLASPAEKILLTSPSHLHILQDKTPTVNSLDDYCDELIGALDRFFSFVLSSKNHYLVFHSSGYDSRINSLMLRKFKKDLPHIHFRCHEPEEKLFNLIMEKQGWSPSFYSTFPMPSLNPYDLGHKDRPLNGFYTWFGQMNFWRDLVPYHLERDYTVISGSYGGEIFDYPSRNYPNYKNFHYCDNIPINRWLQYCPLKGEWTAQWYNQFQDVIYPFTSYAYLSVVAECNDSFLKIGKYADLVRETIVRHLDPSLFDITPPVLHKYTIDLGDVETSRITSSFLASKFYKRYADKIPSFNLTSEHNKNLWGFMTVYDAIF
ncbi:hypothetical protein [Sulfuricurvum sp.]|uniref:hypothetical protein n=1 Tax=Sulfuricurvum sp. TaxID=2025608 RepID=UPI0035616DA7